MICGGPGRIRTYNQTVMSKAVPGNCQCFQRTKQAVNRDFAQSVLFRFANAGSLNLQAVRVLSGDTHAS